MVHFKEFLIKLQTLDIKIIERMTNIDGQEKITRSYEISHQTPYHSPAFKNELKEIKELAITDVLNLSREQIEFQLERLKNLKEKFHEFWNRYYHAPYPVGSEHNLNVVHGLHLDDIFICPRLYFMDQAGASDYFLDDLETTITHRQAVLNEFEETILRVINPGIQPSSPPIISTASNKRKSWPVFKEGIAEEFFNLVKEYFAEESGEKIKNLLISNEFPSSPFVFNGAGNQLADAFKQLFDANLIVGCNKAELESWIQQNFQYRDKGIIKSYTEKYLQDMISSNTKACQSPIFDVKKTDGKLCLLPLSRNNKNVRK
jgi:hypothetical protein